jgi:hypothetical protein
MAHFVSVIELFCFTTSHTIHLFLLYILGVVLKIVL